MTLFDLPQTDRVAARIRESASRNALSHALLLSGNGDLNAAARYAANIRCSSGRIGVGQSFHGDIGNLNGVFL